IGATISLRIRELWLMGTVLGAWQPGKTLPELDELAGKLRVVQVAEALAGHDHDIPASQLPLLLAECLADPALQTVALDREPDALLADHQPEAGVIQTVGTGQDQNAPARDLAVGRVENRLELPGFEQALFPAEASTHHNLCCVDQTVRRLRPLARRRDRTARPFLVAMRARKP